MTGWCINMPKAYRKITGSTVSSFLHVNFLKTMINLNCKILYITIHVMIYQQLFFATLLVCKIISERQCLVLDLVNSMNIQSWEYIIPPLLPQDFPLPSNFLVKLHANLNQINQFYQSILFNCILLFTWCSGCSTNNKTNRGRSAIF